jgi:hypothetical protein
MSVIIAHISSTDFSCISIIKNRQVQTYRLALGVQVSGIAATVAAKSRMCCSKIAHVCVAAKSRMFRKSGAVIRAGFGIRTR